MNYRLSCGVNRSICKSGFVLELNGKEIASSVFKCPTDNIKECILEAVYRGFRYTRGIIKHKDLLIIEIQNSHLCDWLSGKIEYKGYLNYMDKILDELEYMDCRYKFMFISEPYAKKYLLNHDVDRVSTSTFADAMSDLR